MPRKSLPSGLVKVTPESEWNPAWAAGIGERVAECIAAPKVLSMLQGKGANFDKFHRYMVGAIGACEREAAFYLWHKMVSDARPKWILDTQ